MPSKNLESGSKDNRKKRNYCSTDSSSRVSKAYKKKLGRKRFSHRLGPTASVPGLAEQQQAASNRWVGIRDLNVRIQLATGGCHLIQYQLIEIQGFLAYIHIWPTSHDSKTPLGSSRDKPPLTILAACLKHQINRAEQRLLLAEALTFRNESQTVMLHEVQESRL